MITLSRNIALAILLAATSLPAYASTIVEVNGVKYDIVVIEDSAIDMMDELTRQIWWNDPILAIDFANAVYDSHGFPNFSGTAGPLFAHAFNGPSNNIDAFICDAFSPANNCAFEFINLPADTAYSFSRATPVPVPAAAWLFISGLAGLFINSRRKSKT